MTAAEIKAHTAGLYRDRTHYFLGLLLLAASDRTLHQSEKNALKQVAAILEIDEDFCQQAIDDVLKTECILDKPVKFSSNSVARAFLQDALLLSRLDGEVSPDEWHWLKQVALFNAIPLKWLHARVKEARPLDGQPEWAVRQWWAGHRGNTN